MRRLAPLLVVALVAGSCHPAGSARTSSGTTQITVLAAASLTEGFERIGRLFESTHPGMTVRFSFGPSDQLAQQIQEGAPADVFASASPSWMDLVAKDPGVLDRVDFARNRLVVITPRDDPAGISSIGDLARPGVKLVLAAAGVPAGDYARQILDNAGISGPALSNVVSNEEDVKGVVQKVLLGEADAGIVYVTDVTPAVRGRLREIDIPDDVNVVATYPIAVVATSAHGDLAARFVDEVTSPPGQRVLSSLGFMPPG